ncbi:MAG TPA: hypothetical protein PLT36_05620 [Erysipelotrichaceae bacterium]|jgi:hypothetical protein|nr:hypothetical protein [Erysipelotrichaceae bacterium]HQA85488.1 hypothetical protein [Erysipelotrichaceae bacterium]
MTNTNSSILLIIKKLERYQKQGYMDGFEIGEIIEEIRKAYTEENQYRLNKMMEDVTQYLTGLSEGTLIFEEYVKTNIEKIAEVIERSPRTVYRKLQNNSFSLIERQLINKEIQNANNNDINEYLSKLSTD